MSLTVPSPRVSVRPLAALALAVCLGLPASAAPIAWRNGPRVEPVRMDAGELVRSLDTLARRPAARRVLLHFDGPVPAERRAELARHGVVLLDWVGSDAWFAELSDPARAAGAATVPGLVAVHAIDPVHKLHPDLAAGKVHPWAVVGGDASVPAGARTVAVYVMFHRGVDLESEAPAVVAAAGGTIVSTVRSIDAVVAHLPADRVPALAAQDAVMYVEPPLPALTHLNAQNAARTEADGAIHVPYGMTGAGVTVLVYDGGKVLAHGDLAGRHRIGQSDTSGTSDHATHVACTVAGSGAGGAQYRGMAPGADVVSYGFQGGGGAGFLYTNPGDLEHDYTEAIGLHGADLSNNSIGSNVSTNGFPCDWEGDYGVTGALIDEIVRGSLGEPFRVVWANGNERQVSECGSSYNTTAPPACNKNALMVGALNSNDDSVTSFTSFGPCDDGRLRPDVAAPGCQSGGDNGVSSCSSSGDYDVKCGTSMASPTVAGLAALLLEKYRELHPDLPDFRNSLLRSLLAHTAVDLGNPGPDYRTGYGSVRVLAAADVLIDGRFHEGELPEGATFTFGVNVQQGDPAVRVTLAWDDPAATPGVAEQLVNDLDLRVIDPSGTVHHPWTLDPANPSAPAVRTVRDAINNLEQVVIDAPAAGEYVVEVEAVRVAEGPVQTFGVVASPDLFVCTIDPSFAGLESAVSGSACASVELAWSAGESACTGATLTYNVYRDTQPGSVPGAHNRVASSVSATSFVDSGLDPGVTYHYVVRAVDSTSGEESNVVELSAAASTGPDGMAPVFAGLATASAGAACGEVDLAWTAAIEVCNRPVRYEIHRSNDPAFVPGPATLLAATYETSFVDTSATAGEEWTYLVRATDEQGNGEANAERRSLVPTDFRVGLYATDFEADDGGFTLGTPNDALQGAWEWGDPTATEWQPEDDASPDGTRCWITELSPSPSSGDLDGGTTTIVSPAYDLTGATAPRVTYSRWFTNDQGTGVGQEHDVLAVDVSNDGGETWSPIESIGSGTPLAWVSVDHALPVAPSSDVRFRFTASDLPSGSLVEAGIDEFAIVDDLLACHGCDTPGPSSLCHIDVGRAGDDVVVDWSTSPVTTRAVVYHVPGCDREEWVKLGTSEGSSFVHRSAMTTGASFQYRVTFVDECGNEVGFCGATDCP
jgi:subtilisin family serine protease